MKAIFFWIIIFLGLNGYAQSDSISVRVVMKDGNEFIGKLLSENEDQLELLTETYGVMVLIQSKVKLVEELSDIKKIKGEYWISNLQEARYFYGPNGYNLRKGDTYYQNVWIFFNQVSHGFTDQFSVGAGLMPLFLFGGSPFPIWLTPKFSIPVVKDKVNIGTGALMGTVIGEPETSFGIVYGILTLGSRENNVSAGLGYGYAGGDFARTPAITLSGMKRVSKKTYLITENYLIEDIGFISAGGRTVWPNLSLDYGLFSPLNVGEFAAVPWLGIVIPIDE
jgi:hypothetical protein